MKTIGIVTVLVASFLANAIAAQAAPRKEVFDYAKFWEEIANRSGQ